MERALPTARRRAVRWARFAAAWAFAFSLPSAYWAAAVTTGQPVTEVLGAGTIGGAVTDRAADPGVPFVLLLWGTAVAKVVAGLAVLALVHPAVRSEHVRPLRLAVGAAGWAMALYGGANLVQRVLALGGVVGMPTTMDAATVRWHLLLWDPLWLTGGVLFVVAVRTAAGVGGPGASATLERQRPKRRRRSWKSRRARRKSVLRNSGQYGSQK